MSTLAENLAYLQQNAFEFTLNFNPQATCFDSAADFDNWGDCGPSWVDEDQRKQAYETGRFIDAQVYPCGSVSFYQIAGTDLESIVAEMAKCCREDIESWTRQVGGPTKLKTAAYPGPRPE